MYNMYDVSVIMDKLRNCYGPRRLIPHHDPLGELVQTILSQNTSDKNSRPAYRSLKTAFSTWEALLTAETGYIEGLINKGGLAHIKAQRIKNSLTVIKNKTGDLSLDILKDMTVDQGRDWLTALPGVGIKTANCVLLFALGKPAMPVDTHVFRVTKRLGLIINKTTLTAAHTELEAIVPGNEIYEFHVLIIEHGRNICAARNPKCQACVLELKCPASNIKH